ncbi:hypothetical protein LTR85_000920 [Meristemomyces frigidus]|nr:hypothetical protein LTR85_000920 [Meristemomyces frigidus]
MILLHSRFTLVLSFVYLCTAKSLWSNVPAANFSTIIQTAYPIGNGRLAALPFGSPGLEKLSLNRDSLWSGGRFENSSYNGGNPTSPVSQYLPGIREWIWQNGTGNVTKLMGDDNNYGSYAVLGNLSVAIAGITNISSYDRRLDLETGVHTTSYKLGGHAFTTKSYCSYPDDVCVYDLSSSHALPTVSVTMENVQSNASLVSSSCARGQVSLNGITQAGIGMTNGTLEVPAAGHRELTLVIAAGTNYDETHGTQAYNFSFRGVDPGAYVQSTVTSASNKSAGELYAAHVDDYSPLANAFTLTLPDTANSSAIETAELIARYNANSTAGDPFLESLVFDYGRHLFISSSRNNSLPPNLQGKWAYALSNAWGADYHADINIQMNHWPVDQTGLGGLQTALWDYMAETWAPRGLRTAKLLYDAPGWVVHDEVNIFGHTGMKTGDEYWADYPASAAWLMQHVWDYFDYSQDTAWLAAQGYPQLLKPVAEFWLSQLQEDQYFKDGTLVVNPCSSPEHGPTTFGCTHYQQLIYQVFETALQSAVVVGDTDSVFVSALKSSLKLDLDVKNDTHRHLSNLIGWFPGWSLSSYLDGYTNETIQNAVATTLWSRGPGIIDSNAGWEKVWRAACWARLNNTVEAYYELRLTIQENWAPNALSMYSGKDEPFQIDANFGFPGAVLSMLVVDLPQLVGDTTVRTVVLGPAIPAAWANGSVKGLRLRGGGSVNFSWDTHGLVTEATLSGRQSALMVVNKDGRVIAQEGAGYYF